MIGNQAGTDIPHQPGKPDKVFYKSVIFLVRETRISLALRCQEASQSVTTHACMCSQFPGNSAGV